MLKLLRAGLARLLKNSIFRLGIFISAAAGFICPVAGKELSYLLGKTGLLLIIGGEQYSLDYWFFTYVVVVAFMAVLFSGFFLGSEYSDGTLRNKIAAGHSRTVIYLSNFVTSAVAGCLLYGVYLIMGLFGGLALTDGFKVFARREIVLYIVCAFACMVAFAAIYTLIGMLIPNKAVTVVVCIGALLALLLAGLMLTATLDSKQYLDYEWTYNVVYYPAGAQNPVYVGGWRRTFYIFLVNFLPGGIVMEYYDLYMNPNLNVLYMLLGCSAFSVVPTVTGMKLFAGRELK